MPKKTSSKTKKPSKKEINWSISDFYSKAKDITWNNKKLWIFGIAVMIFAGGGNSFNSNSSQNIGGPTEEVSVQQQQAKQEMMRQIGEESNAIDTGWETFVEEKIDEAKKEDEEKLMMMEGEVEDLMGQVGTAFTSVPWYVYTLIVLQFIAFMIGMVVYAFVARSWAVSALIKAIDDADNGKKVDLGAISQGVFDRIKPMIYISVVPVIKFMLALIGVSIIIAFGVGMLAVTSENLGPILAMVLSMAGFIALVYYGLRFGFGIMWGQRECVLAGKAGKESFDTGYSLSKGNLWKGIRLSVANGIVGFLVMLGVMMPVMISVVSFLMTNDFTNIENLGSLLWSASPIVLLFMATMLLFTVVQAMMQVFFYATWNLGYKSLKSLEK